ncbi:MAG: type I methionyl aminopeptidase [Spirochaetes bacterium]|jgi:methionyl aminopeptidase|nr:type I methionyl aminopeptidase [Spirochaetota bacterium]
MSDYNLKSPQDILRIRDSGRIIAEIFKTISKISLDGISTLELDSFIEKIIIKSKARASFRTVPDYNHATCISINHEVVHGIPSRKKKIKKGDIVKVDIGVVKNGYFADACYTFAVSPVPQNAARLISVTKESLNKAIKILYPGARIGDIGSEIQGFVEKNGFSVVRDFTGHGVGFAVHEHPGVPHYGKKGKGKVLKEGMVLAIEPMVNEGVYEVDVLDDGWTVVTADGKLSAQFEHTVAVTESGPQILTD